MTLTINSERLWSTLMESAAIGATSGGGLNRETLCDADAEMRRLFAKWCRDADLRVDTDLIGNMFARRAGRDDSKLPVAIMSHLDSQPYGGRFDGVLGVLAGLEVMRTLNDRGIVTERPIELINWTNEEGSRFQPAMMGSGVFAGIVPLDEALSSADVNGVTVGEELKRLECAGSLPVGGRQFHAAFEIHIEQGPVLEDAGESVGVVTGVQGIRWYRVRVLGQDAHCGATPMAARADAMRAAASMMTAAYEAAESQNPPGVATIGSVNVKPNSPSVVPGEVTFMLDLSHPNKATLDEMETLFRQAITGVEFRGVTASCDVIWEAPAVSFDAKCVAALTASATRFGYRCREMLSGAGHDAANISKISPTAMMFVPCHKGITHNEAESIKPQDAAVGTEVLLSAVLEMANDDA